jgi:hypothetical protein
VFERVEAQSADLPVAPAPSRVDEIFERLRSSSPQRVAKESSHDLAAARKQHDATTPEPSTTTSVTKTPTKAVLPTAIDPDVFRRRDETVTSQLDSMARIVKRLLSDDENSLLTHIGTKRSKLVITAMLPTIDDHAERFATALTEHVMGIAVDAARSLRDARRSETRNVVRDGRVLEAVTEILKTNLVQPLHDRIGTAVSTSAGDRDALMRLVRDVCSEWKSTHCESVVADVAHFAYARGLFLGCDLSSNVCWAVDPNGPACADAEDNALAGVIRHGEPFPTGQAHPLAHAGCRCLVVPIDK